MTGGTIRRRGWRFASAAGLALAAAITPGSAQQARPLPTPVLPPLPPAVVDDSLVIGGQDINGRLANTRLTVPVQVNGHGPFRFVVDSGADTSVIGTRVARALTLPPATPATLHAMTGSGTVNRVQVDTLALGQSVFHDLELPVLEDGDLGGMGLVGIDALAEQRLMLDFEARTIRVEDARRPAPRLDGEIVVVARRRRGQLILTQASLNGRPVAAVIDTGSEVTIGNSALRERLRRRYGDHFTKVKVTGVTGVTVEVDLIRVGDLQLGSVRLENVPIAFADVPPFAAFGMSREPALLLGTDLMETFRRVSLDFRARKVRFQLRQCTSQGIVISTSPLGSMSRLSLSNGATAACRR